MYCKSKNTRCKESPMELLSCLIGTLHLLPAFSKDSKLTIAWHLEWFAMLFTELMVLYSIDELAILWVYIVLIPCPIYTNYWSYWWKFWVRVVSKIVKGLLLLIISSKNIISNYLSKFWLWKVSTFGFFHIFWFNYCFLPSKTLPLFENFQFWAFCFDWVVKVLIVRFKLIEVYSSFMQIGVDV